VSTITEQRTICDMDHGEETRPSMGACLRCGKDICPAHYCDLTVPVASKQSPWPFERIATVCPPCAVLIKNEAVRHQLKENAS